MDQAIKKCLRRILSGAWISEKPFITGHESYTDIYNMASDLICFLDAHYNGEQPICLFTESRGVIASAIMASLLRGGALLLPYAYTQKAMFELYDFEPYGCIITDKIFVPPAGVAVWSFDKSEYQKKRKGHGLSLPSKEICLDNVLLKLFTGGSTGRPQLWSKTIRNLFGEADLLAKIFQVSSKDCFLATVPPNHIYGFLYSILLPFYKKCSVISEIPQFPKEIVTTANNNKVSILISIPIHYKALKEYSIPFHSLRLGISSAGKLRSEDAEAFYHQNNIHVTEIYGSTETGGIAQRTLTEGTSFFTPFEPIQWDLKDACLWIKSPFISPELDKNSEGFYNTNDRISAEDQNRFKLMGRSDGIVKVGGQRVDLEMIRESLLQIPNVRDAIVLSSKTDKGRENEIAALVESELEIGVIRDLLKLKLEPSFIPRRILLTDKIPVSSAGKYPKEQIKEKLFHEG